MSKKNKQTPSTQKLKKDAKKLQDDLMEAVSFEERAYDSAFLGTLASDITAVNEDALAILAEDPDCEMAEMAHYLLSTPWGAPFASDATLLDAALSFQHQPKQNSDLSEMIHDFYFYACQGENPYATIFLNLVEE